jgi:hypothetical protein
MKRSDIYPPVVNNKGIIEGEHLEIMSVVSGNATTQSGRFGWSGESQLWWRNAKIGDELFAKFIINQTGKYDVTAVLTKAIDYGIIQIYINGVSVGKKFNGFYPEGVIPVEHALATRMLSEGENIISVKLLGSDEKARPGNMAGIDYLLFEKVN